MYLIFDPELRMYHFIAENPRHHGITATEVEFETADSQHLWVIGAERPPVSCIAEIAKLHFKEFASQAECRAAGFAPLGAAYAVHGTFDEYARLNNAESKLAKCRLPN